MQIENDTAMLQWAEVGTLLKEGSKHSCKFHLKLSRTYPLLCQNTKSAVSRRRESKRSNSLLVLTFKIMKRYHIVFFYFVYRVETSVPCCRRQLWHNDFSSHEIFVLSSRRHTLKSSSVIIVRHSEIYWKFKCDLYVYCKAGVHRWPSFSLFHFLKLGEASATLDERTCPSPFPARNHPNALPSTCRHIFIFHSFFSLISIFENEGRWDQCPTLEGKEES